MDYSGIEPRATSRISSKAPIRHLDATLLVVTIALTVVGCVAIYSATRQRLSTLGIDPFYYLKRQLAFSVLATIVFILVTLFDYRQLRTYAPLSYGILLLMLLVVLSPLGQSKSGAQRWIDFGFLQVQPSELMKIVLAINLAAFCSDERKVWGPKQLVQTMILAGVPAGLIYLQPDLGTVMVCFAILFAVLLLAGIRARWLLSVLVVGAISLGLAIQVGVLKEYQVARLTAFLDNNADLQRAGYNLAQSKIAIGSGGLTGKGLFHGSQTNLNYVPEQHTDFIFTAIGEEEGFAGAAVLLTLFALIIWRSLRIAMLSKDRFGTLLAGAVTGMLLFQLFVNIGMTIGIMPITGIPLPFVSYGGTALISEYAAVGLLTNIHMRRFV